MGVQGIDDNRLLHMREVGRLCSDLAREVFGWDEKQSRHMFVMGFLHDIGYEFAENQTDHEEIGGDLLSATNYLHAEPIRLHGDPNADLSDDRLLILNISDMTVSGDGRRVGFETRLQDIADRYGKDSQQYQTAARVIDSIQLELERRGLKLPIL